MSTLTQNLASSRHAERYQSAAAAKRTPTTPATTSANAHTAPETSRLDGVRSHAGWLLIGLGLRLAMRGGDTPAHRASLLGR